MSKNLINNIIFDLDGTLIDSSLGIVESFSAAFLELGIEPKKPLNSNIIGPPLMETLAMCSGVSNKSTLNKLAEEFKAYYDSIGYKKTIVFPDVHDVLLKCKENQFKLYIATNKRILPTLKIINFLKWNDIFKEIHSLDSFAKPLDFKSQILTKIIERNNLSHKNVIYIGDREDDEVAAREIDIKFRMVAWGYNSKDNLKDKDIVDSPKELYNQLLVNE